MHRFTCLVPFVVLALIGTSAAAATITFSGTGGIPSYAEGDWIIESNLLASALNPEPHLDVGNFSGPGPEREAWFHNGGSNGPGQNSLTLRRLDGTPFDFSSLVLEPLAGANTDLRLVAGGTSVVLSSLGPHALPFRDVTAVRFEMTSTALDAATRAFDDLEVRAVPEPGALALVAIGAPGVLRRRRGRA